MLGLPQQQGGSPWACSSSKSFAEAFLSFLSVIGGREKNQGLSCRNLTSLLLIVVVGNSKTVQ